MDPGARGARRSGGSEGSPVRDQPPLAYQPGDAQKTPRRGCACVLAVLAASSPKIAQLVLAVLCLVLISDAYRLDVGQNVTAMHFPFIVFSSFTLITGVILFGYATGMKMRELLMRIFGTMGGLLFLISGIHTTNRAVVYWDHWQGMYEEGETEENPDFAAESIPRRRVCFVAQALLSFVAACVYLGDVVFSYRRTMHMLN